MPQCAGHTKNGQQCLRSVKDGETHCHQHKPAAVVRVARVVPAENRCKGLTGNTHNYRHSNQCKHKSLAGKHFCRIHDRVLHEDENPIEFEAILNHRIDVLGELKQLPFQLTDEQNTRKLTLINMYLDDNMDIDLMSTSVRRHLMNELIEARRLGAVNENPLINQALHQAQLAFHAHHVAAAANIPIGADTQSIHRREVSDQTNALMTKLFGEDHDSFKDDRFIANMGWIMLPVNGLIWRDIQGWYNQPFCKTEGDWLYRRTLNAVIDYAKSHEHKNDIRRRIIEEITESVGMCCEGHLARLCNALVGYHEDAVSAVSPTELLQDRMAALAARGGTEEEGRVILRELAIPEDQWAPWLEAL